MLRDYFKRENFKGFQKIFTILSEVHRVVKHLVHILHLKASLRFTTKVSINVFTFRIFVLAIFYL